MSQPKRQLDVFNMLNELANVGISNAEVARRLGISKTRLWRCKEGQEELSYTLGLNLIALHGAVLSVLGPEQNISPAEQNISSTECR